MHRHADATRAKCGAHACTARAGFRDNGRGSTWTGHRRRGRGLEHGLLGIRERAALLGGVATLTSTPGEGSEVRVRFPLVGVAERLRVGVEA